jgi:MFS family permease
MIGRSVFRQSLLNAYWVPLNFQTAALMTIAVPAAILRLAPAQHAQVLAVVATVATALSIVVPPVAGAVSDWLRRRGTPRRPVIVAGALLNIAGLAWMGRATDLPGFAGGLFVATIGQNVSLAGYQPLIPEAVEQGHWGLASGYQGVAALLGTVSGLACASLLAPSTLFAWTALLVAAGTLCAALTPEGPYAGDGERARIGSWHDFTIAFLSRSFINFGLTLLMTFVLYFFHDVVRNVNPSATTGIFGGLALAGAVLTSLWIGQLSDRLPRKIVVALSGLPMTVAVLFFAFAPGMRGLVWLALLFGLGYGAFVSTGWALAIDSVPQLRDVARDLGLWGLASGLPSIAAPAVGGWLLGRFSEPIAGYRSLFLLAGVCLAIGSVLVLLIRRSSAWRSVTPENVTP